LDLALRVPISLAAERITRRLGNLVHVYPNRRPVINFVFIKIVVVFH
jgi:hypothetical protein